MLRITLVITAMTFVLPMAARTMADEHDLSFLIPRGASEVEFENAVVLATPKQKGPLVRLNTYLHFVNTRSETGDLQLLHDFGHFRRNVTKLEGGFLNLPFGVSHICNVSTTEAPLGTAQSVNFMNTYMPLWIDLALVEKVLSAGHISGPRDLYCLKYTPAYRQRVSAALEILLDACSYGQSVGSSFFTTHDTSPVPVSPTPQRQTILQIAAVVNRELPVLQRLHQLVYLLCVKGRRSLYECINHSWKNANDGALEQSRLCLLNTVGIDPHSDKGKRFLSAHTAAGFSRSPFSAIEFEKHLDMGMRSLCFTYRGNDDSPSLMSAFSALFGGPDEGLANELISRRSVHVRSLFEIMMRQAHPQMRWGATGLALRSYLCMLGTPRRAADVLYSVTGCGCSSGVDSRSREKNRISHLHFVLAELVRNRRVVLAIDNFVRIVRVLQNIGRHGSYLLNDSTNFIMTILPLPPLGLRPKYPVELHDSLGDTNFREVRCVDFLDFEGTLQVEPSSTLATMLGCSSQGCSHCLSGARNYLDLIYFSSWSDPCSCFDRHVCENACLCLICRNNAVDVDYVGRGAALIIAALTPRVVPPNPYPTAYSTLDPRMELLSAERTRAHNLAGAAVALAGGTFAMLETESVYIQNRAASTMGRIHDPDLKPRGGDQAIMSRTHVLGLLWVTSNSTQGLLRALLMIRMHPVVGRHLDQHMTALLGDLKIYKTIQRLWQNAKVDRQLLSAFWPKGMLVTLGAGLHVYKKLIERVCIVHHSTLRLLFEALCSARGTTAGKYFTKAKLSQQLAFLAPVLLATHKSEGEYLLTLRQRHPSDAALQSLDILLRQHVPLAFCHMTFIRLASSKKKEDRIHALNVLRHEIFPLLLLSFQVLGSPEYAKIMCEYITRLDYWFTYAPHIYESFEFFTAEMLNEESIELVHAFISIHNTMIRMAQASSTATSHSFLDRGPLMLLKMAFTLIADMPSEGKSHASAQDSILQDSVVIQAALRQILDACNEHAVVTERAMGAASVHSAKVIFHPVLGSISSQMVYPRDIAGMVKLVAEGIKRDMSSPVNADFVDSKIQQWMSNFCTGTDGWAFGRTWAFQDDLMTIQDHFNGIWLTGDDLDGTVAEVDRTKNTRTSSASTRWLPKAFLKSSGVNINMYLDVDNWCSNLLLGLPRFAARFSVKSRSIVPELATHTSLTGADCEDDYDDDFDENEEGEEDHDDDDEQLSSVDTASFLILPAEYRRYDATRQRGPVKFKIGADMITTAANITRGVLKFQAEVSLPPGPRVCGVIFSDGSAFQVPLSPGMEDSACVLLAAEEVHAWISNQMGRRFEKAARALEEGCSNRARRLATAAFYERNVNGPDARDLNRNFTNRAWVLCLTSMSKLVSAIKILNEDTPSSAPTSMRMSLDLIQEAQADVQEVLEGVDGTTQVRWISTSGCISGDAGMILRENLEELQTVLDDIGKHVAARIVGSRNVNSSF